MGVGLGDAQLLLHPGAQPRITLGYIWLLRRSDDPIDEAGTLFFVLLLTLIITLFDRYRHTRDARLAPSWPPATPTI